MNYQRNRVHCLTLGLCLVLSSVSAIAQNAKPAVMNDWSRLNSVTSGNKLSVNLKNGEVVNGVFRRVTDDLLSVMVKSKPVELRREDISSVYELKRKSATKSTLIGLGVGAGAGAAVGVAGRSNDGFNKIDNVATAGLTVIGAATGAIVGYLFGRRGTKRTLIYQAS